MIDPRDFELHPKTVLEDLGRKHFAIVLDRKSRIIMSDGRKIQDKAEKLMEKGLKKISLKTNAPVCSKTEKFLSDLKIRILPI
jgi:hypothetical protein